MKSRKQIILAALPLALFAAVVAYLVSINQEGFSGSRVKNPDSYDLDIRQMNGTDLHALELKAGQTLEVRFEAEKGSLYLEIKAPDGTAVYRGNGKETTAFEVTVPMDGVYPVMVEARHARGSIHIEKKER